MKDVRNFLLRKPLPQVEFTKDDVMKRVKDIVSALNLKPTVRAGVYTKYGLFDEMQMTEKQFNACVTGFIQTPAKR